MAPMIRALDWWEAIDQQMSRFAPVAWALLAFWAVTTAYMLADRKPPFAVLSVEPAAARPGDYVWLNAQVRRDAHRNCSAEFSRYIYDANSARVADLGVSTATAQMIADTERRTPGRLSVRVRVPEGMIEGHGLLVTALKYQCNRTHQWLPIEITTELPFTVLPSP